MLWHSSQRWLKHGTSPITRAATAVAGAVQIWQRAALESAPPAARRCSRRR
jgi:hypothetical protein